VSKLYDGVVDTLNYIRETGAIIVGFTESQFYYTTQRIRTLGLDGLLTHLYSTEDRGTIPIDSMRRFPVEKYELKKTKTSVLPTNSKKPDSSLLLSILSNLKADILEAIYIGDDLGKDVSMANSAKVTSVHAKYGVAHRDSRYQLLVEVTHWTDEDVKRQAAMTEKQVQPDFVLEESFSQLRDNFMFSPYEECRNGSGREKN
jgi:phosphoglycolate phosphatase